MSSLALWLVRPYLAAVADDQKSLEDEPLAEADAFECDPKAQQCDADLIKRDETAENCEISYREELFEAFQPVTDLLIESPIDGMPIPVNERSDLAAAHPFTRETQVCIEDDTAYVELFEEELADRGWLSKRGLLGFGAASFAPSEQRERTIVADAQPRFDDAGKARERRSFDPKDVLHRFGVDYVKLDNGYVLPVRMKRERCKFLRRQIMANDDIADPTQLGHFIRFTNCTIRRSVGGAFMSLRDEAMYACEYRDPVDAETAERHIERFDRERLGSKRHLELYQPFNLK